MIEDSSKRQIETHSNFVKAFKTYISFNRSNFTAAQWIDILNMARFAGENVCSNELIEEWRICYDEIVGNGLMTLDMLP